MKYKITNTEIKEDGLSLEVRFESIDDSGEHYSVTLPADRWEKTHLLDYHLKDLQRHNRLLYDELQRRPREI